MQINKYIDINKVWWNQHNITDIKITENITFRDHVLYLPRSSTNVLLFNTVLEVIKSAVSWKGRNVLLLNLTAQVYNTSWGHLDFRLLAYCLQSLFF